MLDHNTAPRRFQCRHIFTGGRRCGSPCLRHEEFCYYHHTTRRPAPNTAHDAYNNPPNQTVLTLPVPEDTTAIQLSVGEIMNALARNSIDPRRAGLLLYALQIASQNLKNAQPKAKIAPRQEPVVEEITVDPTLGTLAPLHELDEDDEEEAYEPGYGSPTLRRLVAQMKAFDEQQEPPIEQQLNLQAAATPTPPPPATPRPTCRYGYQSRPNSRIEKTLAKKYREGVPHKHKGRLRGDGPHDPPNATLNQASAPQPPAKPGHLH